MKSLILALLYLSFAASSIAQTLQFPKEIVYYKGSFDKPEELSDSGRYTKTRSLNPIGWSADGKFAYAEFYDAYLEGLSLTVTVKDMASDKILWSASTSGYDGEMDTVATLNQEDLWKKLKDSTTKALTDYKIKPETKIDFRKGAKHSINKKDYQFTLSAKDKIQIDCTAKNLGKKTVYKQDISPEDFEYQFGYGAKAYYIVGIIKSPYEDRVVVVYRLMEHGFEFIDDEYCGLVGCQLLTGFK